jgi:hypothetical protein
MNQLMASAGERLNLKMHGVGPGGVAQICGPADIEGHRGKDGLYYVVDTARLFPPEAPRAFLNAVFIPMDQQVRTKPPYRYAHRASLRRVSAFTHYLRCLSLRWSYRSASTSKR